MVARSWPLVTYARLYLVAFVPPGRYVLLKLLRVFVTVNVPSCCAVTLM